MAVGVDSRIKTRLTPFQQILCKVGFVVALTLCIAGSVGLVVLMDEKEERWITRTHFGLMYKKLVAINPIFSAAFVNGGLLGMLMCFVKLRDHSELEKKTDGEKAEASGDDQEEKKTK